MTDQSKLLSGLRVLVADDEPFNLSIVSRMMRELGCSDIVMAGNGGEAMQTLSNPIGKLAFAILDFNMPELNGLQLLKQVRTGCTESPRDLRMLMLTGSADFGLVGAAMSLDVDAFIVKPVSLAVLSARLEKVMAQQQELRPVVNYEKVDIESVTKRLLSRKPVGTPRPKSALQKRGPNGIQTKLDNVVAGAILAEDIRGPNGELVLGKASVLNDRLLRRMKELKDVLNVEYVYIFPSADQKPE